MFHRLLLLFLIALLSQPALARRDDPGSWQGRLVQALYDEPEKANADRERSKERDERYRYSPDQRDPNLAKAASRAEQRHGGKALAVRKVGDQYLVRLLLSDGRVTTVDGSE
ncbi:MAG: hypothetical protein AAF098_14745 [Pseudomonadota bacterium]